jgi:hypothetical protein
MNDKMRKNILELSRTMNPSVIARMSGVSLAEVTAVLGSDNSGAPRNGAMSTMKFTDANLNMVPEGYPRDEIKDPLRINRDTTSQGTEPWQVQSDHAMDRQQQDLPGFGSLSRGYGTSEDRGNPFLTATGTPQLNPHAVGTSHSMVVDPRANIMNPQQQLYEDIGTPYEMPTTPSGGAAMYPMDERMMQEDMMRRQMNPQQFMQEEIAAKQNSMRAIGDLMNPNVPRQGFNPYMRRDRY